MSAFDILAAAKNRFLGYQASQTLTTAQQQQARTNIGADITNLGGVAFSGAQSLTLAQRIQAAKNLGVPCLINTITANNNAPSDTTSFTSDFSEYEIVLQDLVPSLNGSTAILQVQSGGAFQSAGYHCTISEVNDNNNGTSNANSAGGILLTATSNTNATSPGISGILRIRNPSGTTSRKTIYGLVNSETQTAAARSARVAGFWDNNSAITGFVCAVSGGVFTSGTIKVYGIP